MLTFEKVLEVFKDYLEKDTICEVVTTKQGYTVMYWDSKSEVWYSVIYCKTPEIMRDTFLKSYFDFLEEELTQNDRDATEAELEELHIACEEMRNSCI